MSSSENGAGPGVALRYWRTISDVPTRARRASSSWPHICSHIDTVSGFACGSSRSRNARSKARLFARAENAEPMPAMRGTGVVGVRAACTVKRDNANVSSPISCSSTAAAVMSRSTRNRLSVPSSSGAPKLSTHEPPSSRYVITVNA